MGCTKSKSIPTQTPPLLRLPLELRHQIYAHLLPLKNCSNPLRGVGFSMVSHPPPASYLLNIHPQLTDEILEYFYTISTWSLIFSHAFNFFRIDSDLRGLERSYVLRRVRKIECVVFCDVLLVHNHHRGGQPTLGGPAAGGQVGGAQAQDYISEGLDSFAAQIRRRVKRAADVLSQAENLRSISVAWIDTTRFSGEEAMETKAGVLTPLRRLKTKATPVTFRMGRIHGIDDRGEKERFKGYILEVLGESARRGEGEKEEGLDGTTDASGNVMAEMRMLAFDPKQVGNLHRERLAWVARGDAVTGAGVWRSTNMPIRSHGSI